MKLLRLVISVFVLCILSAEASFAQGPNILGVDFRSQERIGPNDLHRNVPNNIVPENARKGFVLPMTFCDYVICRPTEDTTQAVYFIINDFLAYHDTPDLLFSIEYTDRGDNPDFGKITLLKNHVLDYTDGRRLYIYPLLYRIIGDGFTSTRRYNLSISVDKRFNSVTLSDIDESPNQIAENAPADTLIQGLRLAVVTNAGMQVTENVQWEILSEELNAYTVNSQGQVLVQSPSLLDFETQPLPAGNIQATISGISDTLEISIALANALESITLFDTDNTESRISEHLPSGTPLPNIDLEVRDENNSLLSDGIVWSLTNPADHPFVIDSASGVISLASSGSLDYEIATSYTLTVSATVSSGTVTLTEQIMLAINVDNVIEAIAIQDTDTSANTIAENASANTPVAGINLEVRDENNSLLSDGVVWSLTNLADHPFVIDSSSGVISLVSETLDYEMTTSYALTVSATVSSGTVTLTEQMTLAINVDNVIEAIAIQDTDTSDNTIAENASANTPVAGINLEVRDEGNQVLSNGVVWSLTDLADHPFVIDSSSSIISLVSETLDYEMTTSYTLTVSATVNSGTVILTEQITLAVNVDNINETIAIQDTDPAENIIPETMLANTKIIGLVLEVHDENNNILPNESLTWSLLEPDIPLAVNPSNGMIESTDSAMFDFGGQRTYHFTVSAQIMVSGSMLTAELPLTLSVGNVFESLTLRDTNSEDNTIAESAPANMPIANIVLEVRDEDDIVITNDIMWSLIGAIDSPFVIHPSSGIISLAPDKTLDFETPQTTYSLTVEVQGEAYGVVANTRLEVPVAVTNVLESITVTDSDDSSNQIYESVPTGTIVSGIALQVTDEGDNNITPNVVWSLIDSADGLFMINSSSGVISLVSETLNFETNALYNLMVRANVSEIVGTLSLPINVLNDVENVLENITASDADPSPNMISESASSGTPVTGLSLEVRDEGNRIVPNAMVAWSLTQSAGGVFDIGSTSGVISLSLNQALDFESLQSYDLNVAVQVVADGVAVMTEIIVAVIVTNVLESVTIHDNNDAPNAIVADASIDTEVSGIALQAVDENNSHLTHPLNNLMWSFAPNGNINNRFAINTMTGQLRWASSDTVLSQLPMDTRTFTVSIIATVPNDLGVMIQSESLIIPIATIEDARLRLRLFLEGPLQIHILQ